MQNGRGEYRYTASGHDPRKANGTADNRAGNSGTPRTSRAQNQNQGNQRQNPVQNNAGRSGNTGNAHNMNSGKAVSGSVSRQGGNLPSAGDRSGQSKGRTPDRKTTAVAKRGETSVAEKPKGGKLAFWKKVFALTPAEKEHNVIVPRIAYGYDYVFLIIVLVLLAFGSVMVHSASYAYANTRYGDSFYIIKRQAVFIAIGLVAMFAAAWVKPDVYKKLAPVIYIVCFFMLCLVPIPGIGVYKKGARRWLSLLGIDFQPSEAMKFGLAVMLAWYFDRYQKRVRDYTNFWRSTAFGVFFPYIIVGVTCFMIVLEKHLSGTIIMFLIGTIIIFAGGALLRWLLGIFGVGAVALLILGLCTDYTKRRFDLWLHPEKYPQDGGWQTLQGLYAIGSGGFFGVGIGESRQKHMYVSEPQNDFIFTIVCEELGFIGAIVVIALFLLFIYRGIVIAMRAPDTFSSLVVAGIISKVAVQVILNIAVVTASLPNTGISLPFFSYGGTSLCILMAEMGVVLSISRYSKQIK